MPQVTTTAQKPIGISGLPKKPILKVAAFPQFKEVLRQAWVIYLEHFRKFIGLYFLLLVPAIIGGLLLKFVSGFGSFSTSAAVLPVIFLLIVFFIFAIIVGAYSMIFLIKGLDKNISVWQAYIQAWKYFWRYLLLFVLLFIVVSLGFVALVIPGLILLVWFSQIFYVAAFEDIGGIKAFQRSKELVGGYWWTILECYLFWLFISLLANIFILLPLVILALAGVPSSVIGVAQGFISLVGLASNFILIPVGIIYTYLIYKNLRLLKDKSSNIFDGMAVVRKFGIVGLVLAYIILNAAVDSATNNYNISSGSGLNYKFKIND